MLKTQGLHLVEDAAQLSWNLSQLQADDVHSFKKSGCSR